MLPLALRLRALVWPTTLTSTAASRGLSATAGRLKLAAYKKQRVVPQRKIIVDRKIPLQKTDEQLDDESITEQLRHQAGHSLKTRFKGIKYQERYFKDALRRSDKEQMTAASLEGLPDLTEAQIDDFYANLMASGTTLGNLPEVASPTFKARQPLPSGASATEEQFAALSPEDKAQVADDRLRLLGALAGQERRRRSLYGALGVPAEALELDSGQATDNEGSHALAAPDALLSSDVQEPMLETIGVRTPSASLAGAALEVGEDGELQRSEVSFAASSSSGTSGPTWSGSGGIRSSLSPRDSSLVESSTSSQSQTSASEPDGSSASAVSRQSSNETSSAAALLRTVVDPPKPHHDRRLTKLARLRVQRPGDPLSSGSSLSKAIPAPSSSLTLLDTAKDTITNALAASDSAGEASTLDLGVLTQLEWKSLIKSFLSTEIVSADDQSMSALVRQRFVTLAELQASRKDQFDRRSRPSLPLRRIERDRLVLLRERGDLALEALETAWTAGAKFDQHQKLLVEIGAFLVEGGHIQGVERLLAFIENNLHQRPRKDLEALRVSVHLTLNNVRTALATLHELEDRNVAPPQPVYQAVIARLVHSEAPSHRAAGWNLFGHMRLVAHATPTLSLYTEMILACAHPTHPEPERALDLWTEMTIDSSILPDVKAFNAVLLACGRVQRFYPETFRLMRQLLDFYQTSPVGTPQKTMYTPTRATFDALLDGAKRNGDLARARWVLTEMIRFSNHPGFADDGKDVGPTAFTLSNVLDTYAASRAKIGKGMLRSTGSQTAAGGEDQAVVDERESSAIEDSGLDHKQMAHKMDTLGFEGAKPVEAEVVIEGRMATELEQAPYDAGQDRESSEGTDAKRVADEEPRNVATSPIPQSSAEIVQEATLLFQHTLTDWQTYAAGERSPTGGLPPLRFARVTPLVVNGYLAVLYRHDTFANAVAAFKTVYSQSGVRRTGYSWRYFFEFAAHTRERELAASESHALFKEWELFEREAKARFDHLLKHDSLDVAMSYYQSIGLTPDNIRRVFAAMIKIMSRTDQLVIARSFVERFVELYPPSDIQAAVPEPLPTKSLVTLVPRVAVRPDPLPPHLLFADLQPLHERYVVYQQSRGLAYLKYVCSEYERHLRRYREARLSQGAEGATRAKEVKLAREEAATWRSKMGPVRPVQRHLRSRRRSLEDFEGIQADIPDGLGRKDKDARRRKMLGERANHQYHRALRQFS